MYNPRVVQSTRLNYKESHPRQCIADGIIICFASSAFTLLFSIFSVTKPGKLLCFALAGSYVIYNLYSKPTILKAIKQTITRDKLFWSLPAMTICWAAVSASWSPLTAHTIASTTALAITFLTGLYLAARYAANSLINLVCISLFLTLGASLIAVMFFPDTAIMHYPKFDALHEGRWRGVFTHKNWLGLVAGLCSILIAGGSLTGTNKINYALPITGLIVTTFVLYKSESTSALIGVSTCSVFLLYGLYRGSFIKNAGNTIIILLLLLPLCLSLTNEFKKTFSKPNNTETHGFSRTHTFSGRVPHWNHIFHKAIEKPVTGFGYNTFWLSSNDDVIHQKNQWVALQAHSGWLEAILDLGIPVALLFISWMMWAVQRRFLHWQKHNDPTSAVLLGLTGFMFIANTSESLIPNHSGILMILFTAFCSYSSHPQKPR